MIKKEMPFKALLPLIYAFLRFALNKQTLHGRHIFSYRTFFNTQVLFFVSFLSSVAYPSKCHIEMPVQKNRKTTTSKVQIR